MHGMNLKTKRINVIFFTNINVGKRSCLFCRLFACPKKRFFSRTKIDKCCPFGEELELPEEMANKHVGGGGGSAGEEAVKCVKAVTDPVKKWSLRMNGYTYDLQVSLAGTNIRDC